MRTFVALFLLVPALAQAQSTTVPPLRLYDEGVILPLRYRLNMVGAGVSCVDDAAHSRSVCTIAGGSGGGTIGGTIASGQVPVGSGANTIAGSSSFTWTDDGSGDSHITLGGALKLNHVGTGGHDDLETTGSQLRLTSTSWITLGSAVTNLWPIGTTELGFPSFPFTLAYIGKSGALPTCDSSARGAFRTVFAASLSSDTLQVCMKKADDSYAWVTAATAP